MDLPYLEGCVSKCQLCTLHAGRKMTVFSKGNPEARIMVCGMVPADEENEVGIPFVGRAGQLLDKIIAEVGLSLDSVYVTNLVKCYLAAGLPLKQDWIDSCLPYLMTQVDIIKPKVIVTLGKDASVALTKGKANDSLGKIIFNNPYVYSGAKVFATYHPSYLLRGGGTGHKDYKKVIDTFIEAVKICGAKE